MLRTFPNEVSFSGERIMHQIAEINVMFENTIVTETVLWLVISYEITTLFELHMMSLWVMNREGYEPDFRGLF